MSKFNALSKLELRRGKPDRQAFKNLERIPIRVVLDGVCRHYNIGSIFRLCDGLLIEKLYICEIEFSETRRQFTQAARGSQRWIPYETSASTLYVIRKSKKEGYKIASLEQTRNSIRPDEFEMNQPLCLVLGSESDGVSQEVLDMSDFVFELPIFGMINSYNVCSAAAITLYELVKNNPKENWCKHPGNSLSCN